LHFFSEVVKLSVLIIFKLKEPFMNYKIYLLALITHLTCTSFDFVDNKKNGALHSDFFKEIIALEITV